MKICVIGGGNVGTLISAQLTHKNHIVSLYTRNIKRWSDTITVYDNDTNQKITEKIYKITDNLSEAVLDAKFIIITIPSFAQRKIIDNLYEINLNNTIICFYPGTGGGELISKKLINNNVIICGPQRICSVARLIEYGKSVKTTGKRDKMYLGCIPVNEGEKVRKIFEELFDIETELLPNYLNVTLTPSNPILHPSRLYSIFKDYKEGKFYDKIPLFYEDWNDETSEILISCDNELHKIIEKLKPINLESVIPLLKHYDSTNKDELTKKIRSIEGFKGICTPNIQIDNKKYIPDLSSRYFIADIPYGLLIIKNFGIITKTDTPTIDKIIFWYQEIINKEYLKNSKILGKDSVKLNLPGNYGINKINDIVKFYNEGEK